MGLRGRTGFLVAGRAAFSHVYPVTQADNLEYPLKAGLKRKPIGGHKAPGARAAIAHFACVRGQPPFHEHTNRTFHACQPGERPDGTELVVHQENQWLPEFLIEVEVGTDDHKLRLARPDAEKAARQDQWTLVSNDIAALIEEVGERRQLEEAFHADTLILAMDRPLRLIEQRILQATSHHKMQELCARQGESMAFH